MHEVLKWQNDRGGIYFSGMKIVSQDVLKKGGFLKKIGYDKFFHDKQTAIKEIHKNFKTPCEVKAFNECD